MPGIGDSGRRALAEYGIPRMPEAGFGADLGAGSDGIDVVGPGSRRIATWVPLRVHVELGTGHVVARADREIHLLNDPWATEQELADVVAERHFVNWTSPGSCIVPGPSGSLTSTTRTSC